MAVAQWLRSARPGRVYVLGPMPPREVKKLQSQLTALGHRGLPQIVTRSLAIAAGASLLYVTLKETDDMLHAERIERR